MRLVWLLVRRDLRQAWISAGLWLPVAFLLLVASLYPFAVGPDARLLARTGGGMLWIAALLASLLPVDRLIAPDAQAGVLDQMAARGIGEEMIVLARLVAHSARMRSETRGVHYNEDHPERDDDNWQHDSLLRTGR